MLVRSVTPVGRKLLENTGIRFVGTATIGTDHLDIEWLDKSGIKWASAPGCNANAAAQYTLAMLWLACERLGRDLRHQSVGIIGYGNVGSRLHKLLDALNIASVACDPPLSDAGRQGLVDMQQALAQDIVCLHVPLTRDGPCPTWKMMNVQTLGLMRNGALLLNSARGHVIDANALKAELSAGRINAALDVWPGEPDIDPELLRATIVATPHVAGYSVEGRHNGTLIIHRAFCQWAGIPITESREDSSRQRIFLAKETESLSRVFAEINHVAQDGQDMKTLASLSPKEIGNEYDKLRRNYPLRHDFGAWAISGATAEDRLLLNRLGFQ